VLRKATTPITHNLKNKLRPNKKKEYISTQINISHGK